MNIDAPRIKSWVERIERLLAERAGINSDIKDIYAEVKSHEHDGKAIRKLIQRRAQDEGELAEQDALLAAYTDAVAGKIRALEAIGDGASTKEAAKAGGVSTGAVSALRRGVQKSRELNEPPEHDPDTGEITDSPPGTAGAAEQAPVTENTAGSSAANLSTSKETDNGESCGDEGASSSAGSGVTEQSPPHATQQGLATPDNSKERPVGNVAKPEDSLIGRTAVHLPERPSHSAGLAPGPHDLLDIPHFLRGPAVRLPPFLRGSSVRRARGEQA